MAFFEWKDNYSVNNGEIDEQHKQLVSMLNCLHEPLKKGRACEVLKTIIDELVAYTKNAFFNRRTPYGDLLWVSGIPRA